MGLLDWITSCIGYNTEAELKVANVSIIGEPLFGAEDRSTSWESTTGEIKFNFFSLGGPHIAHRVWSDYAKMDAVVYIVSAKTREQFLQQKKELHALLFEMEAFANVPFLIFCIRNPGISDLPEEEMVALLDLTDFTTGRGRVQLADANIRPLEVFVAEEYNMEQLLDGIEWLSHHITTN